MIDPSKIGVARGPVTAFEPTPITVDGTASAAPPGATVRITNLDSLLPTAEVTAADDGSFTLTVPVSSGDELRVDAVMPDKRRAAPVDLVVVNGTPAPSPRFSCVTVSPGLELPFPAPGTGVIRITNGCATAISVSDPRLRLGLSDFAVKSTLPLNLAAGSSGELAIDFAPSAVGAREDVLFVSIASGADSVRYPFTLYRP